MLYILTGEQKNPLEDADMARQYIRLMTLAVLAAGLAGLPYAHAQDSAPAAPAAENAKSGNVAPPAENAGSVPPNYKSRIPQMPGDFPWPGDPRPYGDSRWASHIDRALWFMLNDRAAARWTHIAILDFLQRRFGLHERYRAVNQLKPDLGVTITPVEQERYFRLTEPGFRFRGTIPEKLDTMDDFMTAALYCDVMPIPEDTIAQMISKMNYVDSLPPKDRMGTFKMIADYFYTHLALSLQWLQEKGCVTDQAGANELRERLIRAMEKLISQNGPDTDLGIECMAMLCYLRVPGRVKPAWVEKMVAAQLPDGGWANAYDLKAPELVSNGHTTILALWVLLEQAVPKINDVPWVARASEPAPPAP